MPMELRRPARTFTIRQLCLEFKCTPRALRFYEDKGLLAPARDGMNRVYSYKDRGRLQLILNGKRVGLALAEIGEILDLYDLNDGGAAQNVKSLAKFRERIVALEWQLSRTRPDLLPRAADYDQVLRERLGDLEHAK
jgi:DNA-binding transcriptional MerR regulator